MRPTDRLAAETSALWRALFGDEPRPDLEPHALLEAMFRRAPAADYTTLRRNGVTSPYDPFA